MDVPVAMTVEEVASRKRRISGRRFVGKGKKLNSYT
jgi:hypothetical protein